MLKSAAELQISDLELFARQLEAVIVRKKTTDKTFREKQLLQLINQTSLSMSQQETYQLLSQKIENETISNAEHHDYMQLVEIEEQLRNDRLKYLIELASLRDIPVMQLINQLGLAA